MSVSWDNCLLSGRGGDGFSNVPETLFPEHCSQNTVPRTLFPDHCSRNTVPGTLFPELCSQNSVPGTLFPEHCSRNTVPGTLFPEHCSRNTKGVIGILCIILWVRMKSRVQTVTLQYCSNYISCIQSAAAVCGYGDWRLEISRWWESLIITPPTTIYHSISPPIIIYHSI